MATLGSMIVNVLANTSGFHKAMVGVRGELNNLNDAGDKVTEGMGYLSSALAAIGVGFAVNKVVGDLGAVAQEIDNLAKVADRLGVSTEVFKGLEFGAGLAGVSSESLAGSLQFLSKQIGEAIHGGGKAKVVFNELGLSAEKLSKLTADEQLRVIASSLGDVENEAERTRMALRMFGGDGASMLTFLAEGEAGIKKYMQQAEKLGLTYSRDEAGKVEAFNDAWDTLAKTLGGISKEIVIKISPGATQAIKDLTEAVKGAQLIVGDKNAQAFAGKLRGVADSATGGLATGGFIGAKAGLAAGSAYNMLAGGGLNNLLVRLGVGTTAGAFTDAELGDNAKRFNQFADGLPSDKALGYVNEQQFQRSVFGMIKRIAEPISGSGSRLQEGFKSLSGFVNTAKDFGANWQRSWAFGEVFGRKGDAAIDDIFSKRDTEAQVRGLKTMADRLGITKAFRSAQRFMSGAEEQDGRIGTGANRAIQANTAEAFRAIAESRIQRGLLDQAKQHNGWLQKIHANLQIQTTGLS